MPPERAPEGGSPQGGWRPWLITMAAILSWYASNVALLIANKYLLSTTGFRQPVFLTLCHMVACLMIGPFQQVCHETDNIHKHNKSETSGSYYIPPRVIVGLPGAVLWS